MWLLQREKSTTPYQIKMCFYTISTKDCSNKSNFNIFNKVTSFTNFIKKFNSHFIPAVCYFTKDFKHVSNLIVRRPEIIKLVILTKTITKQLKSKINSMTNGNYLLRIIVISKTKPINSGLHRIIIDREGLIEKYLLAEK